MLEVLATGPLTTVQDRGRTGWSSLGVGTSGAADRRSHDAANRLVGNTIDAATLEVTLGGLVLRARTEVVLAVTGAPTPFTVDGVPQGHGAVVVVGSGAEIRLDWAPVGLRTYVAVRGGIDVPRVLGSRSTDSLSGIGPERVAPGAVLPIGHDAEDWPGVDVNPYPFEHRTTLRVIPGPRADRFTDDALDLLLAQPWTVRTDSDRVGMRLQGAEPLSRSREDELPSEGMVTGALQVPPSGLPVLFLVDHPVTGGYPVIAVVVSADLGSAAQCAPGQTIRFSV
ncbi:biotin-dependent carboxyltransferase family protein [Rhodococcus sp. MEB041]|uniref:5-oxoprolinase subunit C family protein n=1 Tax=Rhodococcus sp. MEB041 TaxID=3040323 RepID=UPI00254A44E6|nr:biotin-dependent carboxyltransferase family protein [Rhodococcus sp. MEB041]